MTALFCRQVLNVSHLLHIDRYASTYAVGFTKGRKRADLIGRAPSGWVVAEAKGRSRAMERTLRRKLVEQKRSVLSIESTPPSLALGCVASFPDGRDMIVQAFDPEEPDVDAISLDELTRDQYLYAYYLPLINTIESGDRIDRGSAATPFEQADFGRFRVQVGLMREIADLVRESTSPWRLTGFSDQVDAHLASARERGITMFSDGSRIRTDWTEVMQAD
ncbi:hypothetical protein [Nocardia cyriacigeorgica]|uniref:hypothetical protein n=1 Tax=Nocardia cyriacigeorgica TaxID=135487 RepID=UPI0024549A59|nr:hypothetical protein [Nocardia cyriacigeorgica]